jgi:hypothetical protein
VDTSAPSFRQEVAPLNPPGEGADPAVVTAAREASTDSFHLAILVAAGLMVVGAVVNAVGIRNPRREEEKEREREPVEPALAGPGAEEAGPGRVDTIPEGVPCLPVTQPTGLPGDPRMHAEPDRP